MTQSTEQLSSIFRQVEADLGTTHMAEFVMDALEESLNAFQAKNMEELFEQFKALTVSIKNTQPRISLIIYFFYEVWEELQQQKDTIKNGEDFRRVVFDATKRLQIENENDFQEIVKKGVDLIEPGDKILVHSHSGTIRNILSTAQQEGKQFDVILAEQEADKTIDMIEYFTNKGINFLVVPEYMLSHIMQDVTKVFFGATTLNYEQNLICDAGSYSVLAEFHAAEIPNYMFLSTKKFSLWESSSHHHAYKTTQKRALTKTARVLNYDRIKFSHDRVPAKLFNYIVTEMGCYTPAEIQELYSQRYAEREEIRKKYFEIEKTEG